MTVIASYCFNFNEVPVFRAVFKISIIDKSELVEIKGNVAVEASVSCYLCFKLPRETAIMYVRMHLYTCIKTSVMNFIFLVGVVCGKEMPKLFYLRLFIVVSINFVKSEVSHTTAWVFCSIRLAAMRSDVYCIYYPYLNYVQVFPPLFPQVRKNTLNTAIFQHLYRKWRL